MTEIWNNITLFYTNWLHPTFDKVITLLVSNQYAIYAFVAVVIILSIVKRFIKVRILPSLIDLINGVIIIFLIIAAYHIFAPSFSKYFKTNSSTTTESGTTNKSSGTGTSTKQNTTQPQTQSQTTKQLYYSVSCYNCWNEACPRNGYNYGGYEAYYYSYYYGLCKSCNCNDFKAVTFWK